MSNNIKIVIPWRETPSRVKPFRFTTNFYKENFPDFEIILCDSGDKLFNAGKSRNIGIKEAIKKGADAIILSDADVYVAKSLLNDAITNAINNNTITAPYVRENYLSILGTRLLINGKKDYKKYVARTNSAPQIINGLPNKYAPCSLIIVAPVSVLNDMGGYDEAFAGWGAEDQALHKKYYDKYNKLFDYIEGDIYTMFHEYEWKINVKDNLNYFHDEYGVNLHGK